MPHVTGIGGVFFKAKGDPKVLADWYQEYLGITMAPWGGAIFHWAEDSGAADAATAWSIDEGKSDRYSGGDSSFMINYRVSDLTGMLEKLKKSGTRILEGPQSSEYGTFVAIVDPEGNKVELWEPGQGQEG